MSISLLRQRLVAVYDADATVQGITGRTTGSLKHWGALTEHDYPIATYWLNVRDERGINGIKQITMQFDAWGNGDPERGDLTSVAALDSLITRAETLFRGSGLNSGGLDCDVNPVGSGGELHEPDGSVLRITRDFIITMRG